MIDVWEIPIPPPLRFCLYICLSLLPPRRHHHHYPPSSLPQSLALRCYLWVCVSVGRRWRSVWLNPDKETNSSAKRHTQEGEGWLGGGRPGVVGWRRGSAQNKTDKRQNAKTLLKHRAMGVLLNSKAPPSPFQQPSPPKTHTCRHTTLSESAEVLGPPLLRPQTFWRTRTVGQTSDQFSPRITYMFRLGFCFNYKTDKHLVATRDSKLDS